MTKRQDPFENLFLSLTSWRNFCKVMTTTNEIDNPTNQKDWPSQGIMWLSNVISQISWRQHKYHEGNTNIMSIVKNIFHITIIQENLRMPNMSPRRRDETDESDELILVMLPLLFSTLVEVLVSKCWPDWSDKSSSTAKGESESWECLIVVEEEDDKALRSTNGTFFEEVRASALIKRVTAIIISEKEKKAIATKSVSRKAGRKKLFLWMKSTYLIWHTRRDSKHRHDWPPFQNIIFV